MASGLLTDWIGRGSHASRPSSPSVGSNGTAIYFETDTGNTFAWTGSAWTQINGGGGGGGSVTSPTSYDNMILGEPTIGNFWPLSDASGGAADSSLGLSLSAVGSPTYHATSLLSNGDYAMAFPSSGNSLVSASSIGPGYAACPFTFEAWVKYASLPGAYSSIFSSTSGSTGVLLRVNTSNHFELVAPGIAAYDTGFALTAGTVYHIVWIFDGRHAYFFVNNVLEYNVDMNTTGVSSLARLASDGSGHDGNGLTMQKAALYFGGLPLNAIARHYTAGTTSTYKWAWNS